MASHDSGDGGFRLSVLNPGGRDPEQHFGSARTRDELAAHAPVNFHAYAACTGGSFYRDVDRAIAAGDPVLLLLRKDFREAERALATLKKAGVPVAISLKETGIYQIAEQLEDQARLRRFLHMAVEADGCLAPTAEAAEIYRSLRGDDGRIAFVPTPYPTHDARWDFSCPAEERRGVFLGTREWKIPSRNHLAGLLAANRVSETTGEPITVFNVDRRKGERLLAEIGLPADRLQVLKGDLPYADYLRVVTRHRIIFQCDLSFVPGQVAGDALLCRMPCVGGNGTIERMAFPDLCGAERNTRDLVEIAARLMRNAMSYHETVAASQRLAAERLGFAETATKLEKFFAKIANTS